MRRGAAEVATAAQIVVKATIVAYMAAGHASVTIGPPRRLSTLLCFRAPGRTLLFLRGGARLSYRAALILPLAMVASPTISSRTIRLKGMPNRSNQSYRPI